MTSEEHPLQADSVYGVILREAEDMLTAAAGGLEMPGFFAWLETCAEGADPDAAISVEVRYDFYSEHYLNHEIEFIVPENVIKGIACRRCEDIEAFLRVFFPEYRAALIEETYALEWWLVDDGPEDGLLLEEARDVCFWEAFGTSPWYVESLSVEPVSPGLFRLDIEFRDDSFFCRAKTAVEDGEGVDGDLLTLEFPLSWAEYQASLESADRMAALLRRIHESFLVFKRDLRSAYSSEASAEIDRLEWGKDEDDPFTSGELVLDADDRVHFASDLPE